MRPPDEAQRYFPFMLMAQAMIAVAFTLIYVKGKEDKPWFGQGVRFGLIVVMLSNIPMHLIYHAVSPFPFDLLVKQLVFDTCARVLMAVVVAWLDRD